MTRNELDEFADTVEEKILVADGFDDAIIGLVYDFGVYRVAYDKAKMIAVLTEGDEPMSESEAIEFLEFNTFSAWVGEGSPIYVDTDLTY
ncbi:hypothetical protein [Photobacterium leiognathi]|uniref:hypothetical protein n=1 Tax=Photobacterium leiognathi TaxID=553611 RepID=UPI0029827EFA|nr:hypothetical protein [Photobacterium leiognathi]